MAASVRQVQLEMVLGPAAVAAVVEEAGVVESVGQAVQAVHGVLEVQGGIHRVA